jgi:hypothetical protein
MDFNTPPDYRAQAEKCLELSERAKDGETKFHWLAMAQACFVLADALKMDRSTYVWGLPLPHSLHQLPPTRH